MHDEHLNEQHSSGNDGQHQPHCSIEEVDDTVKHFIAGTLTKVDVNLLSQAIQLATPPQFVDLIDNIWRSTGINVLDPKLLVILKTDASLVDRLQEYETSAHTHLTTIIHDYYKTNIADDQRTVIKVRYNKFRMWYGAASTAFACAYMLYITYSDLSYADTVLGFIMGTMVSTIVSFYFGSSAKQGDLTDNYIIRDRDSHVSGKSTNHPDRRNDQ